MKHTLVTDDGVRLALHCLGDATRPPVLLVPGTFSNSTFWLGTRGVGFARTLAEAGYYACVLDPRGHGESDRPNKQQHWDIDDWARHDVTTAIKAIASPDNPVTLIGHSAGGAVILAALSAQPELHPFVDRVVTIATPLPWLQPWRGVGAWLIRAVSLMLGRFPARLFRLGPEDELPRVMSQWMTWNIKGHWIGDDGTDYTAGLSNIRHPFLMVAGTADRFFAPVSACRGLFELVGSTAKRFEVFEGLDHVRIVVSGRAREVVWPLLLDFIQVEV